MATKKGKRLIKVDFTGVSAEGGGRLLPEDVYSFEVMDITEEEGADSGQPYLQFEMQVVDGDFKGTKAWDNFSLQPQALWKLRGFLEAAGQETVEGPMSLDPDDMIGLIVTGEVFHEEYKGKTKHRIGSYIADSTAADPEPETKPASKLKKKAAPAEDDDPEFKVKQKVAFKDGKKRYEGLITGIDGDAITVKVGADEYEMGAGDLEAL